MVRSTLTTEQARMLADLGNQSVGSDDNDAVAKPSQAYKWMTRHWDLPFTLMGGTVSMREAGQKYLPKNPNEREEDYRVRLRRAVLTNVFQMTITNLSSKPFTKPANLSEDMNTQVAEWVTTDVDREGNDINKFARMVLEDALVAGKTHILAEFPRITDEDGVLTLADVMSRGLRPYLTHIKARAVIGWKSELVDGVEVLTQVRIAEDAKKDVSRFEEVVVKRVRVLEPGMFELWEQDPKSKEWHVIDRGETALNFIPLTTFYTNRKDFLVGLPPLRDLADMNSAHWESSSANPTCCTLLVYPSCSARTWVPRLTPKDRMLLKRSRSHRTALCIRTTPRLT